MPAFSNAELALKLSDLVDYWSTFNTEYSNWLGGTVTGGPSSDGKFPLTNWGGTEILVECPAKLSDNVGGFADAADASAIAAAASAAAANQSDIDAAAEAVVATAQAVLADADRVAAESAATASSGSASTATTQANLATDRAGYASEWAITIEDTLVSVAAGGNGTTDYSSLHWAAKSATSAGTASGYETAAAASAAAAAQSEVDAALEVTYAEEWAIKAEDVLISIAAGGNGTTDYSAYHWSQKSEDLGAAQVALAAIEVTNAAAQVTLAATEVTYAEEWAIKAEDVLVSVDAGGNGTTEYSAYHWAQKSEGLAAAQVALAAAEVANAATEVLYAEEWAIKAEDVLVSVAAGGNGTTEYSAYHWAQKSEDFAASVNPALLFNLADDETVTGLTTFSHASGILIGAAPVTSTLIGQWNTAYGWGDHSGLYSLVAHVHEGTEIDSTAVTDGYVLTADGAGNSAWEALPASVTSFDELTDTTVTAVTAGEVITWSGTAWINETLAEAGIQPAGAYLTAVIASDVNAEASLDGYVLTSDGAGNAAWEAGGAGGGSWLLKTASYTLVAGDQINVNATSAAATITVAATIAANDQFTVHNQTTSTKVVDVAPNTGHTIVGALGSAVGGTDTIQVRPGETIYLVAVSATVLEII